MTDEITVRYCDTYNPETGYCTHAPGHGGLPVTDETYNGWTNRETWALNLWLSGDEWLYDTAREFAKGLDADDPRADDKARDWFTDEIVPLLQETEIGRSALEDIGSLWRVDWQETADALREMVE